MTMHKPILLLSMLAAGALAAGCSHDAPKPSTGSSAVVTHTTVATPATRTGTVPTRIGTVKRSGGESSTVIDANLPTSTGIPACDDYLASYRACHRAAAIYKPDTIEDRYQQMRHTLLRDSADPDMRPQLGNRCNSLASNLKQALHGKSCASDVSEPASASTSGT
jgi:hypothetical protein